MVQYVVVRGDLIKVLKWPTGALVAQACHACSAVIHLFHDDPNTKAYLSDLDNMHKVVLEVSAPLIHRSNLTAVKLLSLAVFVKTSLTIKHQRQFVDTHAMPEQMLSVI